MFTKEQLAEAVTKTLTKLGVSTPSHNLQHETEQNIREADRDGGVLNDGKVNQNVKALAEQLNIPQSEAKTQLLAALTELFGYHF